jgi:CarboxypepD_reg-like domain
MKKITFLIILANIYLLAYNQVVKGIVLNKITHSPVSSAYVYFDGTFLGTNTDLTGHFKLDISKYATMPITISAQGYNSVNLTVVSPEKQVVIHINPKVADFKKVIIDANPNDKERIKNLKIFKNTFLGNTWNARNCEITNENDIAFISVRDTVKAYSLKPIIIENMALGYRVTYFLDEFKLCKRNKTFAFSGNIFFNEDLAIDETKKEFYDKKRKQAYDESIIFFFRSLWKNALDSDGFVVKNMEDKFLNYDEIVIQKDNHSKYLICHRDLNEKSQPGKSSGYIVFREKELYFDKNENVDQSCISIVSLENDIYFDKNGYFDPSGIKLEGKMSKQRIVDLLPYEYSIK